MPPLQFLAEPVQVGGVAGVITARQPVGLGAGTTKLHLDGAQAHGVQLAGHAQGVLGLETTAQAVQQDHALFAVRPGPGDIDEIAIRQLTALPAQLQRGPEAQLAGGDGLQVRVAQQRVWHKAGGLQPTMGVIVG